MMEKSGSVWLTAIAVSLWLMGRDAETEGLTRRIVKTVSSAALGIGLGEDLSQWGGFSEAIAVAIIMAFGLIILDTTTAVLQDRSFIKEVLRSRIGRGGGK